MQDDRSAVPAGRRPLHFRAADGYELAGDLFEPAGNPRAAVLVAPAMAVPRRYYAPFATFLAEGGLRVLTFDYRGVGGSAPATLRGFSAGLEEWARLDLPAAAAELLATGEKLPLLWVGHSLGGQLFGLVREVEVRAALFVASHSAHWGNWPSLPARLALATLYTAVMPGLASTLGYLPMRLFRQGEDIPRRAALEWAECGRDPDYVLGFARRRYGMEHFDYRGPMRFYAVEDDGFAPPGTVEALRDFFPYARKELRRVAPASLGERRIGHFGPFRPRMRRHLWRELRGWLLARAERVEIDVAVR